MRASTSRINALKSSRSRNDARNGSISALSGSCPSVAFVLEGRTVETDRRTDFKKLDCGDLRRGMSVKVKGKLQRDGSVLAERVEKG